MRKNYLILVLFFFHFFSFYSGQNYNDSGSKCYGYLTELVRSSNFPFSYISKEKTNLLIDNDEDNYILAKLFYDKEISEDSPNSMATIGWVKYDIKSKKLYNVSGNIELETQEELSFNLKYADLFNRCRSCKNIEQKARQEGIF